MQLNKWYDENVYQRLNNKKNSVIIVVMQRLHEEDLINHILQKDDGWAHLSLPAIAMNNEKWRLNSDQIIVRHKGEALHAAVDTRDQLLKTMYNVGGYNFALQYQQGQYIPKFGPEGKGGMWVYKKFSDSDKPVMAACLIAEEEVILNEIFGDGEHPFLPELAYPAADEWEVKFSNKSYQYFGK